MRLAWLHRRLAAATHPLTTSQLAEEYEVSYKTIARDIPTLRAAGLEITGDRHGYTLSHHYCCPFCGKEVA